MTRSARKAYGRFAWALVSVSLAVGAVPACRVAEGFSPAEEVLPSTELLPPQDRSEAFEMLDVNRDGWISREEAAANSVVAANFDEVDRDRDGRLNRQEFAMVALNRSDQPGRFRTPERG